MNNTPTHLYQLPPRWSVQQKKQNNKTKHTMSEDLNAMINLDDIDLSTVETDFPLLASGLCGLQIQECEAKANEKSGKLFIHVKFAITQAHKTTNHGGLTVKTINPGDRGSTLNKDIYYGKYEDTKTGELKPYGLDELTRLREAVFGKAPPGTKFNCSEMLGQNLVGNLRFDPEPKNKKTGEVFGPRTEVASYVRKAGG